MMVQQMSKSDGAEQHGYSADNIQGSQWHSFPKRSVTRDRLNRINNLTVQLNSIVR